MVKLTMLAAGFAPEQKQQVNFLLNTLLTQLRREQAVTKALHIRKARIPILKVRETHTDERE
jgi:hypothetical protein